jgi:hypothetical protein
VAHESCDDDRWFAIPGLSFAAGLLTLASALGPCDAAFSARSLSATLRAQPDAAVVEVADHLHGLPYYLDRRLVQVSYPRETQFEEPAHYASFLFFDLAGYFATQRRQPTYLVLRRSDYETYGNPAWPVQDAGPWRIARVEASPAPAP